MNESRALGLCIKHHDPIGFDFLVRKYEREAYMHAAALLGNREDAAEACQECFAKAFASLSRLGQLDEFYPWFYRILRNHCLNLLSRRNTASDYLQREKRTDEAAGPSTEALVLRDEEAARVWATLGTLKTEFREILALKYLRGYDYQMLSSLLSIPRGTVMSRLYHARKAFERNFDNDDQAPNGRKIGGSNDAGL